MRSIAEMEMLWEPGQEAGWHVLLGANGSGKTTAVRAFALLMMGTSQAYASRADFLSFLGEKGQAPRITATIDANGMFDKSPAGSINGASAIDLALSIKVGALSHAAGLSIRHEHRPEGWSPWDGSFGWFSASFGPFRRFSGGDQRYNELFKSNPRLAAHLTALGEDVALTEASQWLFNLMVDEAFNKKRGYIFANILRIFNENEFLPLGMRFDEEASRSGKSIVLRDPGGRTIGMDQLSDGFRSALCIGVEIFRQMFEFYGDETMSKLLRQEPSGVSLPGIVFIDEIDVHLHPSWQRDIGAQLCRLFPGLQFVVTTHSPIVCRSVVADNGDIRGGVWKLPTMGTEEHFRRIEGEELNRLVYGDIFDAYGTELFGAHLEQSEPGRRKVHRLAELNAAALDRDLTTSEKEERRNLRRMLPAYAGQLP